MDSEDQANLNKLNKKKLTKFMKDFVLGQEISDREQALAAMLDCQQVIFHQNARNHLILVYTREVLMLDLDIGQTVGMIVLDRSCSPILELVPCHLRDGFYLLLENGSVRYVLSSYWVQQENLYTPIIYIVKSCMYVCMYVCH